MVLFYRVVGSLAGLSMMGSGLIILTALLFKRLRTHPYSLVMWLSICDFFFSLKYVFAAIYPNSFSLNLNYTYCQVSGLYTNFFALASISWSAVLSINLILNTVRPFGDTSGYAIWYHLFVWTISGVSTLLVGLSKDIGISADGTCWFEVSEKFHWQFFVPLITYFLLALGATIFSTVRTWNFSHGATRYAVKLLVRMILYVAVFLGAWLGPTVHELIVTVNGARKHSSAPSASPFSPFAPISGPSVPTSAPVPSALASDISLTGPLHPLAPVIQSPEGFNTDSPLTWWTGISVALVGFLNAAIWLSNPAIYKMLKNRVILRYCSCWYNRAERIPLITKLEAMILEDQDSDVHQLNTVFRNNALACLLLGIRYSLTQISGSKPGLSESLKFNAALKRAGRPARDLGPKGARLSQPIASPVDHVALSSGSTPDDSLVPLEDDDLDVAVTDAWAKTDHGSPQAVPASAASSQTARITNIGSIPPAADRQTRGLSGLFELPPPTIDGFEADDSRHLLSNRDFDLVEKMDLSPENLEELDVPDLFTSPFHFRDYAPHVFHNIRMRFGFESQEYYQSLAPAAFMTSVLENTDFSGGRSGSFMCFSPDRRFLIKTIPDHEAKTMMRILPAYYSHIENNPKTLLSPVVGLYALRLVGAPSLNIIVMANLFSNEFLTPNLTYDLKGSWVDRGGKTTRGTRKDNDLRYPFQMTVSDASSVFKQLAADSQMLAEQGVMDYSLLVGVRDLNTSRATNAYIPPRRKKGTTSSTTSSRNTSMSYPISDSVNATSKEFEASLSPSPPPGSYDQSHHTRMGLLSPKSRKRALSEVKAEQSDSDSDDGLVVPDALGLQAAESTDDDIAFHNINEADFNLYGKHDPSQSKPTCARVVSSPDQQQLYVIGIIDILQSYDSSKRFERFFKVYFRCKSKLGLSSTNPTVYQERFCKAMARNVGYPTDPDEFA